LRKLATRQVVFSGGEALLNPGFFDFCRLLKAEGLHITLLSSGLLLRQHAAQIIENVDDVIVSLDGDPRIHDQIRGIEGAYLKMKSGIQALKQLNPGFPVTGRTVIDKMNFFAWPSIIDSAKDLQLNQISFLPADVSSEAFNRQVPWDAEKKSAIMPDLADLTKLKVVIEGLVQNYQHDFQSRFIAESPQKLYRLYDYYRALHGLTPFPYKKCNAPWVSAVVEPDGDVRPCFFHPATGSIKQQTLTDAINNPIARAFRKELANGENDICRRCVCSLYLAPGANPLPK